MWQDGKRCGGAKICSGDRAIRLANGLDVRG